MCRRAGSGATTRSPLSRSVVPGVVISSDLPATTSTARTGAVPSAARMMTLPRGTWISSAVDTRIVPDRTTSPRPPAARETASASVSTLCIVPSMSAEIGPGGLPGSRPFARSEATVGSGVSPSIGRSWSFFRLIATTAAMLASPATTTITPMAAIAADFARGERGRLGVFAAAGFSAGFDSGSGSGFGSSFGLALGLGFGRAAAESEAVSGTSGPTSTEKSGASGSDPEPRSGLASTTAGATAVAIGAATVPGTTDADPAGA